MKALKIKDQRDDVILNLFQDLYRFRTKPGMTTLSLFFLFSFCFLLSGKAFAQSQNITVEPQLIQLDLSENAPTAEYFYTNSTNQTIELSLSMQDVSELEDRGIPNILDPNDTKNYKYGLSSWTNLSTNSLIITPGEKKSVTVFVDQERLSLGGHYATLLAEIRQFEDEKVVKLRAIISSLLFVRTGQIGEIEEADIVNLKFLQDFYSFPANAFFNLQNTGNVELTPHGILTIKDPFGREIVREIVNADSLITLPDSSRQYSIPIASKIAILPPGIYTAHIDINYGKSKVKNSTSKAFFSLGSLTIDRILILSLFGIGASILFFKLRGSKKLVK
jgi:hypothetical protein